MAHELYLNNNNGNNHLSWSCQMLIKLHDTCNGPHCPPRDGPKHPVFSPIRTTLPTSSSSCLLLPACPASLHSQGYAQGCKQQNYVPPSVEYSLQMGSHWGLSGFHFFTDQQETAHKHVCSGYNRSCWWSIQVPGFPSSLESELWFHLVSAQGKWVHPPAEELCHAIYLCR